MVIFLKHTFGGAQAFSKPWQELKNILANITYVLILLIIGKLICENSLRNPNFLNHFIILFIFHTLKIIVMVPQTIPILSIDYSNIWTYPLSVLGNKL